MHQNTVRVWLVDGVRSDDGDLSAVVYATPDGSRFLRHSVPESDATESAPAAVDVAPDRLTRVADPGEREVYATGVTETRQSFGADDVAGPPF